MRLLISKEYDESFNEELYTLKTSMLQFTSTHLFIASNQWDAICIEIDDSIPENCLQNLKMICSNISVKLPNVITDKTLRLLCELFPDKVGPLRRSFMCTGNVEGVLSECLVH